MAITVQDVVDFLGDRAVDVAGGDPTWTLTGTSPLGPGKAGHISFASRTDAATREALSTCQSSLILVSPEMKDAGAPAAVVIVVERPRLEFARVTNALLLEAPPAGIHPRAVVDPTSSIGGRASISAGAVIGSGVRIGTDVDIGANAVIGDDCWIGDNVHIGPGTVIGYTGFGYARETNGAPVLIPHTGNVVIGDRVHIGANTAIDRGTMDDTVIEDDVKIDNLVHIAHNCRIRRGAFVIATAIICGGVEIGEGAWVSPNAAVREQLHIGDRAIVGLSATVVKDVPPDTLVIGSPARPMS